MDDHLCAMISVCLYGAETCQQVSLLHCAICQVDYAGPLQFVHCMHVRKGVAYLHQSALIASSCAAAVQLGCD